MVVKALLLMVGQKWQSHDHHHRHVLVNGCFPGAPAFAGSLRTLPPLVREENPWR